MRKANFEVIKQMKFLKKLTISYQHKKLLYELYKKRLPVLKRKITLIKNQLKPLLN